MHVIIDDVVASVTITTNLQEYVLVRVVFLPHTQHLLDFFFCLTGGNLCEGEITRPSLPADTRRNLLD